MIVLLQALPDLNSELPDDIALAPCVQFIPHLNIPTLHLANRTNSYQCYVRKDTVLLALQFNSEQTLGIHRRLEDIFSDNQNDRNIVNFALLKYSAEAISKIAIESYKKDIQSFKARSVKNKMKKKRLISDPTQIHAEVHSDPQDIFSLSDRNHHTVLQSATLIYGLLNRNFASTSADLQKLQCSDLKLCELYDKTKDRKQKGFIIISKILYKIGPKDFRILCVPELLCRQIVEDSHACSGVHFKTKNALFVQ